MFEIIVLLLVVQVIGIIFLDSKVSNIQGILERMHEDLINKTTIINVEKGTIDRPWPAGYQPSTPRPPSKP